MRPLVLALLAFLALVATPACTTGESPKALAAKLATAKTSDEEAALYGRIHRRRTKGLSLAAYDREGHFLQMSEPSWLEKTYRLQITIGDETIDHIVIDPKNTTIMMGE